MTVTIGGVSVDVVTGSISIDHIIEERSTTVFAVPDSAGTGSYPNGTPVIISDDSGVLFSGVVDYTEEDPMAPAGGLYHTINCIDWNYLADKRLVIKSYSNKTLEFIVEDIMTDYLVPEGVSEGSIQTGPTLDKAIFNYVSVTEAFNALQELTGYIWRIDEDKKLYFVDRSTYAATWNLDNVVYRPIKGTAHLSGENPFYRNTQYVKGGKGLTVEQTEVFIGDGTLQSFALGYPCALVPTSITDSVLGAGTIGIKGLDTGKDYYWSKGDLIILAAVAPVAARTLTVVYYGQYPLISLAVDHSQVLARAAIDGTSGIVETIATEAQHETSAAQNASAKAKITTYAKDAQRFTYQVTDGGLLPGQLQKVTYAPFGLSATEMLIETINITAVGADVRYLVTCIVGPVTGSWAKFFSNILVRQDLTLQVGDGQLLALLQQIEPLTLAEAVAVRSNLFPPDVGIWIALPPAQGAGHHVRHEALALAETPDYLEKPTERYFWTDPSGGDFPYTFPITFDQDWPKWDFFTWG